MMKNLPIENHLQHDPLYSLISSMQEGTKFNHPVTRFQVIETHISYILLTGPYAYKFKKPVDLGFLDFSTLAKRKFYCEEEIRLNKRLAPGIYRNVIAVTGDTRHPQLNGRGDVLEYAVKMVQFSEDDELERVLLDGRLNSWHIDSLAASLAEFHNGIDSAAMDTEYGTPSLIRRYIMENFIHIRPAVAGEKIYSGRVGELESWAGNELERLGDQFMERRKSGFIRECHGDVHVGNIAIHAGKPVIFDCIEFNPELHWIDTMSDAAFLKMDLDARGQGRLANRFLNRYLELTGDYAGLLLLRFYLVYRALVRCKVACIRLGQADLSRQGGVLELQHEHRYLDLGNDYIHPAPPLLIITHGLSGSGKTVLTRDLLELLPAVRLRSDMERKRLHGLAEGARSGLKPGHGIYSQTYTRQTYEHLAALADKILAAGFSVIVDATFLKSYQRGIFRHLAAGGGYTLVILDFQARVNQLRDRITERIRRKQDASEADLEVLDLQVSTQEPLSDQERKQTVAVANGGETTAENVIRWIRNQAAGRGD